MSTRINRERIKVLRLGKSWTQQRLADESRVSLRSIQRIENDGTASLPSRAAIAEAFGIEPAELAYDDTEQSSIPALIAVLVLFSYCSFYLGLWMFEISMETLPLWSIPLLPSITILIFGCVLYAPVSTVRKTLFSLMGCLALALLLSPPDPSLKQFAYTLVLWIIFEAIRHSVNLVSTKAFASATSDA